jgi:hypothetical protein
LQGRLLTLHQILIPNFLLSSVGVCLEGDYFLYVLLSSQRELVNNGTLSENPRGFGRVLRRGGRFLCLELSHVSIPGFQQV